MKAVIAADVRIRRFTSDIQGRELSLNAVASWIQKQPSYYVIIRIVSCEEQESSLQALEQVNDRDGSMASGTKGFKFSSPFSDKDCSNSWTGKHVNEITEEFLGRAEESLMLIFMEQMIRVIE